MGYHTEFHGQFNLNRPLDKETHEFLTKLASTRRMKRRMDPKYGVQGEFYVDAATEDDPFGQNEDETVIDGNRPPRTQPSLWCQWIPNEDGTAIEWDGGEKFYDYIEWIEYIQKAVLDDKGYHLTGTVYWDGEESGDLGQIEMRGGKRIVRHAQISYHEQDFYRV